MTVKALDEVVWSGRLTRAFPVGKSFAAESIAGDIEIEVRYPENGPSIEPIHGYYGYYMWFDGLVHFLMVRADGVSYASWFRPISVDIRADRLGPVFWALFALDVMSCADLGAMLVLMHVLKSSK